MTDSEQLYNLKASSASSFDPTSMYKTSEYLWLPDINQGSYSSNVIQWDTLPLKQNWVIWADSFLAIPLRITGPLFGVAGTQSMFWSWTEF